MTLVEKIKAIYPLLTDNDFANHIIVQNDGDVDYIAAWNHPSLTKPTAKQLAAE